MIKTKIRNSNVEMDDVLRMHVESRLGFALGRFADRIAKVVVRFSQAGGERSGSSKRCQIEVGLRPQRVEVEDVDQDPFAAVNHATDRASRSVARALEREATYPGISRGRNSR